MSSSAVDPSAWGRRVRAGVAATVAAGGIITGWWLTGTPGFPTNSSNNTVTAANIWVDTNGGTCTRSTSAVAYSDAAACSSLNNAFQKAQNGDLIVVKDGSYSTQTIFPNAAVTSAVTFKPETPAVVTTAACNTSDQVCFTNVVKVAASHIEMDNFRFDYTPATDSPTCASVADESAGKCTYTPGFQVTIPDSTGSGATYGYACTTDVTLTNDFGHSFALHNGISNVTFSGGTWGYIGEHTGDHNSGFQYNAPQIGGSPNYHCPDAVTVGAPATNVTFNGVHFGDDFQGCTAAAGDPANCQYPLNPCTTTAFAGSPSTTDCTNPSHNDCLHIFGETIGLTIENSYFDRCSGMYINFNVEKAFVVSHTVNSTDYSTGCDPTNAACTVWGELKNATIQNNWFGDATPSDAQTFQILNDSEPTPVANAHDITVCNNVIFRNNTFVYNGQTTAFHQFAMTCPVQNGASTGLQFYSNYFKNSVASSSCGTTAPYSVVWDYNVFDTGTTSCGTNATTTADPKLKQSVSTAGDESTGWTFDFHPLALSPLLNAGSPTNSSPSDCDGNAWSGTPNAGAC